MGRLEIRILEATNLPSVTMKGAPNPYVVVKVEHQYQYSLALQRSYNPTWNEILNFSVADSDMARIKVEVWSKDKLGDRMLGESSMAVAGLIEGQLKDVWFNLDTPHSFMKRMFVKNLGGRLHITVLAMDFNGQLPLSTTPLRAPLPYMPPQPVALPTQMPMVASPIARTVVTSPINARPVGFSSPLTASTYSTNWGADYIPSAAAMYSTAPSVTPFATAPASLTRNYAPLRDLPFQPSLQLNNFSTSNNATNFDDELPPPQLALQQIPSSPLTQQRVTQQPLFEVAPSVLTRPPEILYTHIASPVARNLVAPTLISLPQGACYSSQPIGSPRPLSTQPVRV